MYYGLQHARRGRDRWHNIVTANRVTGSEWQILKDDTVLRRCYSKHCWRFYQYSKMTDVSATNFQGTGDILVTYTRVTGDKKQHILRSDYVDVRLWTAFQNSVPERKAVKNKVKNSIQERRATLKTMFQNAKCLWKAFKKSDTEHKMLKQRLKTVFQNVWRLRTASTTN